MPPSRFSRRNDINSRGYCLKLFSPGCSCGSQTHPVPLVCSCSAGVKLEEQIPAGWGWQNKDRSRWDPPRAAGTFLVESRELRRASEHPCSTRMGSGGSLSIWGSGQSPGGQGRVPGSVQSAGVSALPGASGYFGKHLGKAGSAPDPTDPTPCAPAFAPFPRQRLLQEQGSFASEKTKAIWLPKHGVKCPRMWR